MACAKTSEKISLTDAIALLQAHRASGKSTMFSVVFTKKDSTEERSMKARFGVTAGLSDEKKATKPTAKQLAAALRRRTAAEALGSMNVWDMDSKGYRKIYLPGLKKLTLNRKSYVIG